MKTFTCLTLVILLLASCERRQQILREGVSKSDDGSAIRWKEFLNGDTFTREVTSNGKIILIAKAQTEQEFRDSTFSETSYFEDGKLMATRNFQKGKQNGVWKSWYSGGQLKSMSVIDLGVLRDYVSYYEDGSSAVTSSRQNNGTMTRTERWLNGNLKEEFTTDSTGKGFCTDYYSNGRKKESGALFGFIPEGLWNRWDSLGNGIRDTTYGLPNIR